MIATESFGTWISRFPAVSRLRYARPFYSFGTATRIVASGVEMPLSGEPAGIEKLLLDRCRFPPQHAIAMRKSAEFRNDIAMGQCVAR